MVFCKLSDDEEEQQKLRMYLFWLKKADQGIMETPSDCDIPHEFLCPITHELMQDPVICSGIVLSLSLKIILTL